jgi:hypothetical protein
MNIEYQPGIMYSNKRNLSGYKHLISNKISEIKNYFTLIIY